LVNVIIIISCTGRERQKGRGREIVQRNKRDTGGETKKKEAEGR
jgi:hypothetical protein